MSNSYQHLIFFGNAIPFFSLPLFMQSTQYVLTTLGSPFVPNFLPMGIFVQNISIGLSSTALNHADFVEVGLWRRFLFQSLLLLLIFLRLFSVCPDGSMSPTHTLSKNKKMHSILFLKCYCAHHRDIVKRVTMDTLFKQVKSAISFSVQYK